MGGRERESLPLKGSGGNPGWVFSLRASSPTELQVVEDVALRGAAFEIHIADSAVYVAEERSSSTSVRYLDISAADGSLVERGSVIVDGTPAGRFHMDAHQGTFRIVTRDRARDTSHLHVLDVTNPDRLERLASLDDVAPGEELFATRFVENKAYIVTYQPEIIVNHITEVYPTDPLWVVSLEDPEQPVVLGRLEIPGWSDYLFPRGDVLLAVGRGDAGSQVAASLFDVSDPGAPTELRRLQFGSASASSEASSDFRAVRIIEDEIGAPPLVVVPYSDNVTTSEGCVPEHHLQLIELAFRDLGLRGNIDQRGRVLRTLPLGDQLVSVTSQTLASHDVSDRDAPSLNAEVSIGDPSVDDECVLPPEAPQRIVTVNDRNDGRGGWWLACSVRQARASGGGSAAGWAILASLWAGLRRPLLRRRGRNIQGRRQVCRSKE